MGRLRKRRAAAVGNVRLIRGAPPEEDPPSLALPRDFPCRRPRRHPRPGQHRMVSDVRQAHADACAAPSMQHFLLPETGDDFANLTRFRSRQFLRASLTDARFFPWFV